MLLGKIILHLLLLQFLVRLDAFLLEDVILVGFFLGQAAVVDGGDGNGLFNFGPDGSPFDGPFARFGMQRIEVESE